MLDGRFRLAQSRAARLTLFAILSAASLSLVCGATASAAPRTANGFPSAVQPDAFHKGLGPETSVPTWAKNKRIRFSPMTAGLSASSAGSQARRSKTPKPEALLGPNGVGTPPLNYYGGTGVEHNPHIYAIFWGSNWNNEPGLAAREAVLKMYEGLTGSDYQSILTQYFDESGRISSTVAVTSFMDTRISAPKNVNNSQFYGEIREAIASNGWPMGLNSQFVIFPAPESTYEVGWTSFCAFHGWETEGVSPYSFTFVPYAGDEPFKKGCKLNDENLAHRTAKSASHEYAESATDPGLDSWFTENGGEIADICSKWGDFELPDGAFAQPQWDNYQYGCSLADAQPAYVYAEAGEVTEIHKYGATLHTLVYPEEDKTSYRFEYGLTAAYGTSVPSHGGSVEGTGTTGGATAVEARITGLEVTKKYHYRVVASNSTGTYVGPDRVFTSAGPTAATGVAQATSAEVTLNGAIDPRGVPKRRRRPNPSEREKKKSRSVQRLAASKQAEPTISALSPPIAMLSSMEKTRLLPLQFGRFNRSASRLNRLRLD